MILAGERRASPADLARFQAEARTVASLNHSNFVQIYDVGESNGHPYLRLEYVSGGNLEDWLDRLGTSCLAPAVAARHVERLARATHHMHEKGLVHRDLKPANVLVCLPDAGEGTAKLEECELKISDFGLVRNIQGPGLNTRGIIGTPAYMAPEQATGGAVDRRADIYSLGAILYRLLTQAGRRSCLSMPPVGLRALIQPGHEPVAPSQLRPDLPPALDAICLRSLAKDPAQRQASAKELAEDLRRFLESCRSARSAALETVARVGATPFSSHGSSAHRL